MEPELERPYEQALVSVKEKLPESDFLTAQEAGAKMTIEQAIKFALENID